MDWEKIFANNMTNKRLISKISKQLTQLNVRQPDNPIKYWVQGLNRHFSREEIQMANRHTETSLALLIIREMQIKTTMRYHFTPVRKAVIKKYTNHKCWRGCGEKGTSVCCWWKCTLVQPLWKTV